MRDVFSGEVASAAIEDAEQPALLHVGAVHHLDYVTFLEIEQRRVLRHVIVQGAHVLGFLLWRDNRASESAWQVNMKGASKEQCGSEWLHTRDRSIGYQASTAGNIYLTFSSCLRHGSTICFTSIACNNNEKHQTAIVSRKAPTFPCLLNH